MLYDKIKAELHNNNVYRDGPFVYVDHIGNNDNVSKYDVFAVQKHNGNRYYLFEKQGWKWQDYIMLGIGLAFIAYNICYIKSIM